jgi:hypothetical protein
MATALSGRALLVSGAVLALCAGGVVVAAAVGASPAATPQLGGPVVVVTKNLTGWPTTSPATSPSDTGEPSGGVGGSGHPEGHRNSHDAQVVQPAPVHEVDDEESGGSRKSRGG